MANLESRAFATTKFTGTGYTSGSTCEAAPHRPAGRRARGAGVGAIVRGNGIADLEMFRNFIICTLIAGAISDTRWKDPMVITSSLNSQSE